jgi:hypothetical protein
MVADKSEDPVVLLLQRCVVAVNNHKIHFHERAESLLESTEGIFTRTI